jgi:hypothetical protein
LNLVEHIGTILKCRIQWCRASEGVTAVAEMQVVLQEEWEKITVEETNKEIAQLPKILQRCLSVNGSNNYHAYHSSILFAFSIGSYTTLLLLDSIFCIHCISGC